MAETLTEPQTAAGAPPKYKENLALEQGREIYSKYPDRKKALEFFGVIKNLELREKALEAASSLAQEASTDVRKQKKSRENGLLTRTRCFTRLRRGPPRMNA